MPWPERFLGPEVKEEIGAVEAEIPEHDQHVLAELRRTNERLAAIERRLEGR